jgi:hypothetical protein
LLIQSLRHRSIGLNPALVQFFPVMLAKGVVCDIQLRSNILVSSAYRAKHLYDLSVFIIWLMGYALP